MMLSLRYAHSLMMVCYVADVLVIHCNMAAAAGVQVESVESSGVELTTTGNTKQLASEDEQVCYSQL